MQIYLIGVGLTILASIFGTILSLTIDKDDTKVKDILILVIASLLSYFGLVFILIAIFVSWGPSLESVMNKTIFKAKKG